MNGEPQSRLETSLIDRRSTWWSPAKRGLPLVDVVEHPREPDATTQQLGDEHE